MLFILICIPVLFLSEFIASDCFVYFIVINKSNLNKTPKSPKRFLREDLFITIFCLSFSLVYLFVIYFLLISICSCLDFGNVKTKFYKFNLVIYITLKKYNAILILLVCYVLFLLVNKKQWGYYFYNDYVYTYMNLFYALTRVYLFIFIALYLKPPKGYAGWELPL